MTYPTGHKPDHPALVARRIGLLYHPEREKILGDVTSLPMATTNRSKLPTSQGGPGGLNQGDLGACEGFAHATTGTLRLAILGQSQGLISPIMLYLGALLMDRQLLPTGILSMVTDAGTMPSSIQAAWLTFGAQLAANDPNYPATRQTLYQNPTDDNSPLILPKMETLYAAGSYRYKGTYFITSSGPQRLLEALATLASGRPMTDAIAASGSGFQGYGGGIITGPQMTGPIDHANTILDYEWAGTPTDWSTFLTALSQGDTSTVSRLSPNLVLHCINSWGAGWGEGDLVAQVTGGAYRADTTFFDAAEDLCVVDLQAA